MDRVQKNFLRGQKKKKVTLVSISGLRLESGSKRGTTRHLEMSEKLLMSLQFQKLVNAIYRKL